jgi:hypothetical protein
MRIIKLLKRTAIFTNQRSGGLALGITLLLCLTNTQTFAQEVEKGRESAIGTVNFTQLSNYLKLHPEPLIRIEQEDDDEDIDIPRDQPIPDTTMMRRRKNAPSGLVPMVPMPFLPTSPDPTDTFESTVDNGTSIPPDTHGAVDSNYCLTAINTTVKIQSRSGGAVSSVSLNSFFSSVNSANGVFDPRVHYDPYTNRWILVAVSGANNSSDSTSILIGVTQTSNPTGSWYLYRIRAFTAATYWLDYPDVGFNGKWVVITGNLFQNSPGSGYGGAKVFAFDKATLLAGTGAPFTAFTQTSSFTICPALTYDASLGSMFAVETWNGGASAMKLWKITGAVGSESMSSVSFPISPYQWQYGSNAVSGTFGADFAPQSGVSNKVQTNDSRVTQMVYMNGSLWFAHTVFLPYSTTVNPTRSSVQWWQTDTTGSATQVGLIDDATGSDFYAFPSIAVNPDNDALIGFSTFSSSTFPSAAYALRVHTDATDSIRPLVVFRHGLAKYYKTYGGSKNRWGDYSGTCLDPLNNSDFWTIQEASSTPISGSDKWDTWWAHVEVPAGCTTPASITGTTSVCVGATTTLADATSGGTWSSSTTAVGTVGSSSGVVRGISGGTTTITYSTGTGCNATTIVTVTAIPTVSAGGTTTICSGASTGLTATGATTYTWSPATALSATTGASVTANPTSTITYTIAGTTNGCTGTGTKVVSVNATPSISAGSTVTICSGASTGLTATGGTTYAWSPGTGLSSTTGASVSATPTATTTYTVTGTTSGCSGTATKTVSVNSSPSISTASAVTICSGSSTGLSASGGTTYTWSPSTGLSATTGSSVTATPTTTTTYTVTGTTAGCSGTATRVVSVNATPTVSAGSSVTICSGSSTAITATGGTTYTWSPGTSLSATTGATVTATPTTTTTYTVTGTTSGCSGTATKTVSVNSSPSISTASAVTICSGSSTGLSASGGTTYTWSPSTGLSATTGASVTATPTTTTTYTVTGTTGSCSGTATRVVSVNATPSVSAGSSVTICSGSSTGITATGGTTYTWSPGTGLSATTGATVSANPTATTTYTITGTTSGCSGTATKTVSVNSTPTINSASAVTICSGSSTGLSASGGTTYTWSPSTGLTATTGASVTATPTATTTYTVTGTTSGCSGTATRLVSVNATPAVSAGADVAICPAGSAALVGSGATTYTWSPGNGLSATTGSSVTATPTVTTTYTLVGTTNGCSNSATVTVTVNATLPVSAGSSIAICNGSSTGLTASGATVYTWTPGTGLSATTGSTVTASPTVTTTYTLLGTSGSCSNTATVIVSVNPLPDAGSVSGVANMCVTGAVTFSSSGTGGGTWSSSNNAIGTIDAGGNITGISAGVINITYTVTNGCGSATATRALTVNPLPDAGTISGSNTVCIGSTTTLSTTGTGGSWSSTNTAAGTIGSASGIVTGIGTGVTTISYFASSGCGTDLATYSVSVNSIPTISAGSNVAICAGSSTGLTATGASTYVWTPSSGLSATTGASVTASPTTTTTYTVVGTTGGCSNSATVTVTVNSSLSVSAGSDVGICTGGSTTLTATGATTYTWSPATGLSATTGASVTATPTTTTTYTVTGTSGGCSNSSSVTVTVGGTLSVSAGSNVAICISGSTSLTGSGATTYSWSPSTGLSATTGTTVTATPTTTTTYTVVGTSGGCTGTAAVTVSVNSTPSVSAGADISICIGSSTVISATGGVTYTWAPATGLSATTGASVTASPTVVTIYTVTGTIPGCTGTATKTISINSLPTPSFTVAPNPTLPGLPVTFSSSTPSISLYSWNFGDATSGTGSSTSHAYATATTFTPTLTATDGNGCNGTATLAVTVNGSVGAISGSPVFCIGDAPDTLTHPISGGTWTSSVPTTASVGLTTGIVTALAPGYAVITYHIGAGYTQTITALVAPLPPPITGYSTTCVGSTTGLIGVIGGSGTWSSSDAAVATIGTGSGVVSGLTQGTATMTYTNAYGCYTTRDQTINETPAAISGTTSICAAASTTLTCTPSGGTWLSSNTGVATVGSSTGIATGVTGGTATISYILATGCSSSVVLSATSQPSAITGTLTLCAGGTTTLSCSTTGGTWSSSDGSVATINVSSGLVTAIGTGTATITYTGPTGCARTTVFTVSAAPAASTGNTPICVGGTTTLSNATSGGTWSSSATGVATAGISTGLITGISSGTANITYSISGTGCFTVSEVTVDASPAAIVGSSSICIGDTAMLTHPVSGGTWSSNHTYRATIDATTGQVIAVSVGLVTITYHLSSTCYSTFGMVIKALPAAISGTLSVCEGSTTTLTCSPIGGAWTSGSSDTAYINASTGVATGVLAGTTTITYSNGCLSTAVLTVNSVPAAITGVPSACVGGSTTLACATSGGTWSSSNTGVAIVGSSTGVVSGLSAGTSVLSYIIAGGCSSTVVVTIGNPPAAITGTLALCVGGNTTISAATAGGTWSSSNSAIVTTGTAAATSTTLSAVGTGTAIISYTVGGCASTATATVSAGPAANSGTTSICVGTTSTFTNATSGGTWSSSSPAWASVGSTSGIVTGLSAGVVNISYITGTGCYAITTLTVLSTPAAITGGTVACIGQTTALSHPVSGGTWASGTTSVGTVDGSSGVVTGIAAGTTIITYTVSPGCFTTTVITVYGPPATIGGTGVVCEGASTTLTNSTYGGTWISGNTGIASIDASSGMATGISSGVVTITYQLTSTGCFNTTDITVNALPAAITGNSSVCVGSLDTLSSATSGGTWSTSSTAVAPVGTTTGIVTGNAGGAATISYTLSTGCRRTFGVTVVNLPGTVSGTLAMCISNTTTLTSATAGQTWSSSNAAIASVGSATSTTGLVTGVSTGTATISYTNASGCSRTVVVTVNAGLPANTGDNLVCVGQTVVLSNATSGGTWQSSTTAKATVGYYTGIVNGVATGTSNITYKVASGCVSITQVTVNAAPAAITGTTSVCIGQSILLSHTISGGSWSTTSSTATVDGSGRVTGVSAGYAYITYSLSSGCTRTITILVRALPHAIAGPTTAAIGSYILLTDATSGGAWSSSDPAIASMPYSSLGYVLGVSTGSATISYTVPSTGCFATYTVSVYSTSARPGRAADIDEQSSVFSVFPNPTSGAMAIHAETGGELILFALDGKIIQKYQIAIGETNILLPDELASGSYLCRFKGNDGSTNMVRLVVEK